MAATVTLRDDACVWQVFWLRDGLPVDAETDSSIIISNEGSLIISEAHVTHTGNYSCGAVNVAGRRLSEPALLTVYGSY